jgi:periplasmic divalent cation tolerance protein
LTNFLVTRRHSFRDLSKVVVFDAKADFHMTDKRIVMTTAGSVDEARRIAETLVDRKLAACVNIVPKIVSIYRWKGKVEEAEEWLLWVKTAAPFERVRDAILEMHSYELPECLSISIEEGSQQYLKWLDESVE